MPIFAVIGAGHGGLAIAGHLGTMGHPVRLWSRSFFSLQGVSQTGGVFLQGAVTGFGPVQVSPTLSDALAGADVILVVVPASAHGEVAAWCAPYLGDGQKVLLLPGRTAGAIEFLQTLRVNGCTADVLVGEAQTFIYASRRIGPDTAVIHGMKRQVMVAALPGHRTGELLESIQMAFPQFRAAPWVWKTSMDNIGAIFHPAVALLNSGRIESTGGSFRYYRDGITPSVAKVLEQLDVERVSVARAIGVDALSAREWLGEVYGVYRSTLFQAIQETPAYEGVGAPDTLIHRYIWEDVPTGLVPINALARVCGIETPMIDTIIGLACGACGWDFRRTGRTLERLGMDGWTVDQISRYAWEGEVVDLV